MRPLQPILSMIVVSALIPSGFAAEPAALEWVDGRTGHRVVQLSRVPGNNASFYHHLNPFSPDGRTMAFANVTREGGRRIFTVDLTTYENRPFSDRDTWCELVGPKTGALYSASGLDICRTDPETRETTVIATIPRGWREGGAALTINCDETRIAGTRIEGADEYMRLHAEPGRSYYKGLQGSGLLAGIYVIDLRNGEQKVIHHGRDWYDHLQFSPTDPELLMYGHQGPWWEVEPIWTIHADGTDGKKVFTPSAPKEIAGHAFWSQDGSWIWFDMQRPYKKNVFLAGIEEKTGKRVSYPLSLDQWSFHYAISHDGTMFAGDGGIYADKDGCWINLYTVDGDQVKVTRLVDLANHKYELEPNVHFSPDDKWVMFRSNLRSGNQAYAVEIAPAK